MHTTWKPGMIWDMRNGQEPELWANEWKKLVCVEFRHNRALVYYEEEGRVRRAWLSSWYAMTERSRTSPRQLWFINSIEAHYHLATQDLAKLPEGFAILLETEHEVHTLAEVILGHDGEKTWFVDRMSMTQFVCEDDAREYMRVCAEPDEIVVVYHEGQTTLMQ